MKKILLFIFIALISLTAISQERTVTKMLGKNDTYYKYTGVSDDTLVSTNQDTIDIVFQVRVPNLIKKIEVKTRFDMLTTADTTVAVSVFGRNFTDDSYTQMIASTVSDAVITDNVIQVLTGSYTEAYSTTAFNVAKDALTITNAAFDVPFTNPTAGTADTLEFPAQTLTVIADTLEFPTQTTTVTPVDYSFRFIRVRYIISGDDAVGTGIKIDEVELIIKL